MTFDHQLAVIEMVAEQSQDTGMCVDQSGADPALGCEADVVSSHVRQRPEIKTDRACNSRQLTVFQQVVETDFCQKVRLPAWRLMAKIGPFRGQRAMGATLGSGGFPGQKVGEVEKNSQR